MAEKQWLSASTDVSPENNKKRIMKKIPTLPHLDPPRQHKPGIAFLKQLGSAIKSLFTSEQSLALYRTAPDRPNTNQLANLLARDGGRRCDTCCEFQKSGQAERVLWRFRHPVWCSGCGRKHPLLFFSARQRDASPSRRILYRERRKNSTMLT